MAEDAGDQSDRDLHSFDAMLARLEKKYPVDNKRIYCTGHSNGAGFTNLLWLARPIVFAAVARCSGAAAYAMQLTPSPAMILCGCNDEPVKFEWQEMMMEAVRKVNGREPTGQPWQEVGTLYPSRGGTPLINFTYAGAQAMEATEPALNVKFFQKHPGKGVVTQPFIFQNP